MKKIVAIISFLPCFLFSFSCGNGQDPGPIDCKDLCFTAVGVVGGSLSMEWHTTDDELTEELERTIEVSQDGRSWHTWDGSPDTAFFPLAVGEKFYIRNTNNTLSKSADTFFYFQSDKGHSDKWEISGDISSLINYSDEMNNYSFYGLFGDNDIISDAFPVSNASKLLLPADKLSKGCYEAMFKGCSDLKSAPQLPATQLADSCYKNMFFSCNNLQIYGDDSDNRTKFFTAPNPLPDNCCTDMFKNCNGDAPEVVDGRSYYYENQIYGDY